MRDYFEIISFKHIVLFLLVIAIIKAVGLINYYNGLLLTPPPTAEKKKRRSNRKSYRRRNKK